MTPRERRALNTIAKHALVWCYAVATAALICLAQHPDANQTGCAPPVSAATERASK